MSDEHVYYNALSVSTCGDFLQMRKLLTTHGNWASAYKNAGILSDSAPEKEWQRLDDAHIRLILSSDPDFPPLLREIPWPPHAIYLRGAPIGAEMKIAIVGTRKATPTGTSAAQSLARDCCRAGLTVVSGLAFGIDAASHQGSLDARGKTIAVLASGTDQITPYNNVRIGERILAQGGTIISEYPIGAVAHKSRFIERNRLVSGLSRGVIVIEAPRRSGTLSTARFAIDQNRELFVIPGGVNNPNYAGSHALIKSGATLITEASDVLEALGLSPKKTHTQPLPFLDEPQQRIVELLSATDKPLSIDLIARRLEITTSIINEAIALLTIEGIVKEDSGAYYM